MSIKEDTLFVFRWIKERRLRSWLTVLGIVIGVAAIVGLITITQGLENAIQEQFETFGISNLRIIPADLRGPPTGELGFDADLVDIVEKVRSVEYVNPVLFNFVPITFQKKSTVVPVLGYDPELSDQGFVDLNLELEKGAFLKLGQKSTAVIGASTAKEHFATEIRIKQKIEIEGEDFSVIGILKPTGTNIDDNVFIPLDTARTLFGKEDFVNIMVVKIKPGIDLQVAAAQIRKELEKEIDEEDFEIFTPAQLIEQFGAILDIVGLVFVAIAAIALIVGGIGIANSMFTSVLERTRQIGVMKAIGAQNYRILRIFLIEAGLLGLFGGILGVIVGRLLALGVEIFAKTAGFGLISTELNYFVAGAALFFAVLVGVVSGIIPAWQASKQQPVEALRYE